MKGIEKYNVIRFTISDNDFWFLMQETGMYICRCLDNNAYKNAYIKDIIEKYWDSMHIDPKLIEYFVDRLKITIDNKYPEEVNENGEVIYLFYNRTENKWCTETR